MLINTGWMIHRRRKGRGDEEEKEEKGKKMKGQGRQEMEKEAFPLRSLWQESSGISRGLVVNQNLNPPGRRIRRRSPSRCSPPILRAGCEPRVSLWVGLGLNTAHRQVASSGKNIRGAVGGESS